MFIKRYMYNHIVLCGNVKINIACVSTTCTRLHAELLTPPPSPNTHTLLPLYLLLDLPFSYSTVHTLIKVIYLIPLRPLQPPLCATLLHLPPVSFPTLLLSSRFLSGGKFAWGHSPEPPHLAPDRPVGTAGKDSGCQGLLGK